VLTEWRGLPAHDEPHKLSTRIGQFMNEQILNEQVMSKQATSWNWLSVVPPMRYANVPTVGARYWTAISLASVFGCNLGDFVSLYLYWGTGSVSFPWQ
jgi:hypothetical protein